jgi:hypothetical protein
MRRVGYLAAGVVQDQRYRAVSLRLGVTFR